MISLETYHACWLLVIFHGVTQVIAPFRFCSAVARRRSRFRPDAPKVNLADALIGFKPFQVLSSNVTKLPASRGNR
jgi:hypothetical protein